MQANIQWLTDPEVFRVNRLDAHSDHVCYASARELAQGETSLRQSLDGQWRFAWSPCPARRPAAFWQEDFDDSAFGTIQVPGHMELQGFGQIQYINTLYPWDGHAELRPPQIDWEHTAVGSYVRRFDLAPGLLGKRICVSFQGVEQAFYLWCNGHFVGYAEDSFTPSDFDLTPYVRETGNRLCVEVYQHSSAGWLEDQDFFRFSGIFRSVYLYAKPEVHLEDLWLQAGLAQDNTTGTLTLRLLLSGAEEGAGVSCTIRHPAQGTLWEGTPELRREGAYLFSRELRFGNTLPWCHETPELYQVTLTLLNAAGEAVEVIPYEIGFRRFELKDGLMLLNGKRLVLRGVNRHEWNPRTGRAIGMEDMRRAMDTFLRSNINAVRTCHYPNQTPWYHMCDRSGIYMMDETNLESHGSWQKLGRIDPEGNVPGSLPQWKECVLDRARSMFERDKNHVSILFWSCGNESYAGADILAMADWFRAQDPGRLVHYEGVVHNREFDNASDVESRMYAAPPAIREYLERDPKKPFLLCEYMHDMGNSIGGMESYIRLEEEYPRYQGGFIWDYMDQALWHKIALGQEVLGYGGDFADRQSDYAFSGNGIVFADGTEKPAMQEVRYWYAPAEERAAWDAENKAAADRFRPLPDREAAPLTTVHGDGALGVRGDGFEVLFSYVEGGPVSLKTGGREWLWRAPRPAYWRAPTENDLGNGFAAGSSLWAAVDSWQKCGDIQILADGENAVSIRYTFTAPAMPGLKTQVTYTLKSSGCLDVDVHYFGGENRPQLPLFGLRFATPSPVEQVEWTGLSGETYPDRRKGGRFGTHRESPHIPGYLVPQECGNHMDTRQTRLRTGGSDLVLEMTDRPYAFSAIPYTPQQLSEAYHTWELPAPCRTVVTVCGAMRGVGGIDSWGSDVEEAYHVLPDRDIRFSFRIRL
ncbi:MAG: glycoside hydrolase family 2 TIM barrel-domain containing protein [Candidatus Faecousia sp.]|nr:glycoside hydrolase family 2 TIM barrel-domain containing protein [Candidatus Faecousia sp.]